MSKRISQVGFSQRVRLEWFRQTANLVLAGNDQTAVNGALEKLLEDKVSIGDQARRGNRQKIITILTKVWLNPPPGLELLRLAGLELLKRFTGRDHLAVHWGMVMAVYPFWSGVATQVGSLLRLQGSVASDHVQHRIREVYGDRETVAWAARCVLRSHLDWGVLQETETKGIYNSGPKLTIYNGRLIAWLVEASLHTRADRRPAPLNGILDGPNLFPFRLKPMSVEDFLTGSSGIDIVRHGLDDDLVVLRK